MEGSGVGDDELLYRRGNTSAKKNTYGNLRVKARQGGKEGKQKAWVLIRSKGKGVFPRRSHTPSKGKGTRVVPAGGAGIGTDAKYHTHPSLAGTLVRYIQTSNKQAPGWARLTPKEKKIHVPLLASKRAGLGNFPWAACLWVQGNESEVPDQPTRA